MCCTLKCCSVQNDMTCSRRARAAAGCPAASIPNGSAYAPLLTVMYRLPRAAPQTPRAGVGGGRAGLGGVQNPGCREADAADDLGVAQADGRPPQAVEP